MYVSDFDNNGTNDPIITYFKQNVEVPLVPKDDLVAQLPGLKKKFISYESYAEAGIDDLFTSEDLASSRQFKVNNLASGWFENQGDLHFEFHPFPSEAQLAPVYSILTNDFNDDGKIDLLLGGNTEDVRNQLGFLSANHGVYLEQNTEGAFIFRRRTDLTLLGQIRGLDLQDLQDRSNLIIVRKSGSIESRAILQANELD